MHTPTYISSRSNPAAPISFLLRVGWSILELEMAKLLPICIVLILGAVASTCKATTYTVGDSSGWDISTDLNTWAKDKTFAVGDVLSFQYQSSETVEEVSKESYDNCSTTNALQTYSNGNTSVPLTRSGAWYFISGNRLYCLGGMKLQVDVVQAASPGGAPQAAPGPGALTKPGSKSNTPSTSSSSDGLVHGRSHKVVSGLIGLVATVLWVAHV
ncbi:blue copper protein [Rhodamnia argentea]|uniref:Blue copper protein n=1 Tax=Rhodamnia argentea TaxID=178133 RepID=A0A8B8PP39_9MYRT|nr:blue copper protein [Rhodamnia argentea]